MGKYGVTTFCAPPTIFRFMIKSDMSRYDFSRLKYAVTAGEPLNPSVYESFLETTGLRLMEGYGQTETVVCISNYPWMEAKPGSMGKPAAGYDILLVGKNDKICEVGEEGEIVIRTDKGKPVGLFTDYPRPRTPGTMTIIIPEIPPGETRMDTSGSSAGRTT